MGEEFLVEREYLLGVSKATLTYYKSAFKTWEKYATDGTPVTWIQGMKAAGLSPVSINTHICAMNAYWKWANTGIHLKYVKEEQSLIELLTPVEVGRIISYKPKHKNDSRIQMGALVLLDCGLRIDELLRLKRSDVDMANMLLRVHGKGSKQRLVPFSHELRKRLFLFLRSHEFEPVFATHTGVPLSQRNALRDYHQLLSRLHISKRGFHCCRHTFACEWLKHGGDIYQLSRMLGHSSISTTQIYLKSLGMDTIQKRHSEISILSRR